jgi:uncharacterized membrane protein HdeD (DUF308 family)
LAQVGLGFRGTRCHLSTTSASTKEQHVIILGIILILIGWLASISILTTIGIILVVVGAVLYVLGATGRAVGGRKHWF